MVLTGTVDPAKAFAGFANPSVLLVVVAFLVANAVVKCGLGRRISLLVVSVFGGSKLGLGYSIFLTECADCAGVPRIRCAAACSTPSFFRLPKARLDAGRSGASPPGGLSDVLRHGEPSVVGLWLKRISRTLSAFHLQAKYDVKIDFVPLLLAASVPALATILLLPLILSWLFPPGVTDTPEALASHAKSCTDGAALARRVDRCGDVCGHGDRMGDGGQAAPEPYCGGLRWPGVLLATNVLTLEDIDLQGSTLVTFLWLAVLFALSGQLNELGFMGYVGGRLTTLLGGVAWPVAYVALVVLYVLMHYMFVSQSAQVLALFGVFLDVAVRTGVPASLMAFALLFASSYFSTITPQGGSQNVIFVGSNYLTQGELYWLGLLTTGFCLLMFLVLGTPWLLFVAG